MNRPLFGVDRVTLLAMRRASLAVAALLLALTAVLLSGCGPRGLVRSALAGGRADAAQGLLVVPADFAITEITFGKTEERVVPAERHAAAVFTQHVQALATGDQPLGWTDFESLTPAEQRTILQHRALFATMVSQMLLVKSEAVDAWADKQRYFDYSLGPGMADIGRAHRVDTALFVVGKDKVRSTSRKVLDAFASVLPIGESLSSQPAAVVLGVVDMRTGHVLMFDSEMATRKALTDDDDVRAMGDAVLSDFRSAMQHAKAAKP
jgi:hypothetical protein